MELETFLVSLYVFVDDWWRSRHPPEARMPGRPASLSESEVLTLAILTQWPHFRSELSGGSLGLSFAPTFRTS